METLETLSSAIRNGDVRSSELLVRALERAKNTRNINAVVALNQERAFQQAGQAERELEEDYRGPLHGIPISIKDTYATTHIRTSFGTPIRFRCRRNAELVDRLEKAGAIIFGKSNMPAMSFDWQVHHPRYGRTVHPHDESLSPGGSSGGSAASVLCGISPVELGSDIAGSLRVPAAMCGLTTIRPTEGTVSLQGHMAIPMSRPLTSLLTGGPLAQNLADLKTIFAVLTDLPQETGFRPLKRIAVRTRFPLASISEDVENTIMRAVERIQSTGIEVVEETSDIDFTEALQLWGHICGYELARGTFLPVPRSLVSVYRRFFSRLFGNHLFSISLGEGMALNKRHYEQALSRRQHLMERFEKSFSHYDLLLTPVGGIDAIPVMRTGGDFMVDEQPVSYADPFAVYNCSFSTLGHPIVVVGAGRSAAGRSVGVQLHGARNKDYQLLEFAETLSGILD